jgi:hypothetical protein
MKKYYYDLIKIRFLQRYFKKRFVTNKMKNILFVRSLVSKKLLTPAWNYLLYKKAILIQKLVRGYLAKC